MKPRTVYVTVNGRRHRYYASPCEYRGEADHPADCIQLEPDTAQRAPSSQWACCGRRSQYAYTHGGDVYRAACDRAEQIRQDECLHSIKPEGVN